MTNEAMFQLIAHLSACADGYDEAAKTDPDTKVTMTRREHFEGHAEACRSYIAKLKELCPPTAHDRAELGIDGNCGFALLGPDIQEGEAEFVEIEEGRHPDNQLAACKKALAKLRDRLGMPKLNFYFGASHPYGG